ncbi:MTRF1L release factor glutamine methyltransferase isoform X2 [Macrotis lagotis]|uniref:MTRF1L release factor glutamine methyltransferase isoform X2 n=1 Tax=Macrotis lagotis TaxID=92651 RepID=UPI003D69D917
MWLWPMKLWSLGPQGVKWMGAFPSPLALLLPRSISGHRAPLVTATALVNHWTQVFEERGVPEARESSQYIVAHVLGAKTELVNLVLHERSQRCQEPRGKGTTDHEPHSYPLILDMCCGSGAIALSLLSKLSQSRVVAVDKGEEAIQLTRENAQRLHLENRIQIVRHDILSGVNREQLLPWGPVDFVVSNPPYIFHRDMEHLAPEILSYEDTDSLDGGEDGMRVIKEILSQAPMLLKDSGSIFLEVDPRHPELVEKWLQSQPDLDLSVSATHVDFCGKPRFLHIHKSRGAGIRSTQNVPTPQLWQLPANSSV